MVIVSILGMVVAMTLDGIDFLKEDKSINLKGSEQLQLVSPTGGTGELAKLEQPKNHSATATS